MNKIEQSSLIVFICIITIILLGAISMIIPKSKSELVEDTTTIETTTEETTTTSETTTKKSTTTTRKTTTRATTQATGSKQEYINYAREVSGYDETEMNCLINLWNRESGWNANAYNKSSGACGIPQALPCSKISNKYGDNSYQSQIKWGIDYIRGRYGTACSAWSHFQTKGWY